MFRILIADNDKQYRKNTQKAFKQAGFSASLASTGKELLELIESEYIDLLVLSAQLQDIDSYDLVKQLQAIRSEVLIMVVANKYDLFLLKKAFTYGADEFVAKTTELEEVILRSKALLKRAGKNYQTQMKIKDIVLDAKALSLSRNGDYQTLPKKEFLLLYKLVSAPGTIFTREQLMDEIWGVASETTQSTLNVHANRLRTRLKQYPEIEVKAVRGMGYKAELHI